MNNSRSIIGIGVFAGALIFSVWLGVNIVTEQLETLIKVAGGLTLIACALLGRRIWMILPLLGGINLSLALPGNPSTLLIGQVLFCGFSILLFMTRKLHFQPVFSELGLWVLLLTLCVLQTYVRNPVGLNIFGGESVGARPYILYVASLVTCVILGSLRIPAADLKWVIRLTLFGSFVNLAVQSVAFFVPRVGDLIGGGAARETVQGIEDRGQYGDKTATRIDFLGYAGRNLSLFVGSFISPLRACFHPLWAPLVLLSFAFAALSGFRNEIGAIGLTYLIALTYRGGFISVFMSFMAMFMGVALLAIVNSTAPLPPNVQRALSFLPGTWDQAYVLDSKNSTDWRVDMWKEALFTDFWIHNKILGDGLGMTKQELNYVLSISQAESAVILGTETLSRQQEFLMASGEYHSGPVSSIRVVGYVGLLVLLLAQFRLAVHAHRQIQRARNTEWFPLTLFIGIPLIWAPIYFVFIFGAFGPASISLLLGMAMVRLLETNLPLPQSQKHNFNPAVTSGLNQAKLKEQRS